MNSKAMKALRKAVEKKAVDDFEVGTVIRWVASAKYRYAVIKTEIGWVSTSRYNNGYVPATMDFDELVEVLARSETTEIEVASTWESIAG